MKIGHVVRAERVRQDMKQIVLARGICTPSYLSKIERNLIDPSDEVVGMLMDRLGMDPNQFQQSDQKDSDQAFSKLLKDSYRNVITKRDKSYTKQQLDNLLNENPVFYNQELYYNYLLITLRFRLILGDDLEERRKELDALDELVDYFDDFQLYLYRLNKALYAYSTKKFVESIEYFEAVFAELDNLYLDDWELAEFHYMIGVAYAADSRILNSLEHIKKALTYFIEHFLMKRVVDCYILSGVNHKLGNNFPEALHAYLKAQQICNEFKLEYKGLILHNLGSLYSAMENGEKAIECYEANINNVFETKKGKLVSTFCLVLEHSKLNNKKEIIKWCNTGLALYEDLNDDGMKTYKYQLEFLKSMHSEMGLSEKIAAESLAYFKDIQDYQLVSKYSIAMADLYYQNRKYKLSSELYAKSVKYSNLNKDIKSWEDL